MSISRSSILLGVAWLVTMLVLVAALVVARQAVISSLSTPAAQAQWQRWKQEETARQADPQTSVKRRVPNSPEPPALVLMRDSFPAIVAALTVVATLCFAFGVLSLRGLRRQR